MRLHDRLHYLSRTMDQIQRKQQLWRICKRQKSFRNKQKTHRFHRLSIERKTTGIRRFLLLLVVSCCNED